MRHFIRYNIIGIVNTIVGYGVIFGAMYFFAISPEISNLCGYLVSLTVSFYLNRNFNFKSSGALNRELTYFILAFLVSYTINLCVLFIAINYFALNVYLAQVIGGLFYTITFFIQSKLFVFRTPKIEVNVSDNATQE